MKIRISASLDDDLHSQIVEISKKDNRTFSAMVEILLRQAVKERLRKKRNVEEVRS